MLATRLRRVPHLSVRVKIHQGVDDPEQAWILGELIRYLEHPNSGALAFDDMGPNWVAVRDQAREGTLSKRSDGIEDIAQRWDQLVRFASLQLGADTGQDVQQVLSRQHRTNPATRSSYLSDRLAEEGALEGTLRVPNTAGDIDVVADLRAQQITASIRIDAPDDKKARGRIGWLTRQLRDSPMDLVVEAWAKSARSATMRASLSDVVDDPAALLGDDRKPASHFRLVHRADMGRTRRTGRKSQGFVDSVLQLLEQFYELVVQDLAPYQPKAPQIRREPSSTPAGQSVPQPVLDAPPPPGSAT